MAIVRKEIHDSIALSASKRQITMEFIPSELDVANLATLFSNKTRQESVELMEMAWEIAEVQALAAGYAEVLLGKSKNYGFSKGAMVFVGTREETDDEFNTRIERDTDRTVTELRRIQTVNAREDKKDRDELARLQAKLGVKS